MGELPIYCDRCIGNDHPHKNHFLADEAGVRAFYRDLNDPKNAEKYAEMSEVSVDSKGKCRWEREAEDEYFYYAEVLGQDVFHAEVGKSYLSGGFANPNKQKSGDEI